jgi:type IV pilus assembly protein PilM
MALPFLNGPTKKKRDQIIAIDLGGRTTKAVHMQRKGDVYTLLRYCVMDAPIFEKSISVDLLVEHLKAIFQSLETKTKFVSVAIGVSDSLVRQAELPQIPMDDMRQILKMNSKNYLQQDLPGYTFDCHFITSKAKGEEALKLNVNAASQKLKVLVGGAKKQLTDDVESAIRKAGLIPDRLMPGLVGPVNAFELAMPDIFSKDAVALVDIGFKSTTICLLNKGDLIVSRVVNIGGDKLTQGLAESMSISYAEAEGIKVGMAAEVQSNLEPVLTPLGRELRASIDFFEHQQDRTVGHVYMSGGSARSEHIVKGLETQLMAPCRSWNPAGTLQMALPPAQIGDVEQVAPQLAVAIGAAAASF